MRGLVRYYNHFEGEYKEQSHTKSLRNSEANLLSGGKQFYLRVLTNCILPDTVCISIDKNYLNYYSFSQLINLQNSSQIKKVDKKQWVN